MSKKSQISLIFLLVLCMVMAVLMLAACVKEEHHHTYGEWEVTPATCETAGQRARTCTECGKIESREIRAMGHKWDDGVATTEATCESDGEMLYTCTRTNCEKTYTETINALGHDWQELAEIYPATCEEDGLRSVVCSRCDAHDSEQVIPALGHDWNVVQTEWETCQHGAQYLYTCKRTNCTATETKTTEPVAHKLDSGVTVVAMCESEGSVTYTCTFDCGYKIVNKTNALGHQWSGWTTVTQPDCTNKGSEKHSCTRIGCGKTETRAVAELGHSWSNDYVVDRQPTLEQDGLQSKHCTRSGCTATNDPQTIPKLDADTPIEYTVTVKDPCGDTYLGVATINVYDNSGLATSVSMVSGGVTKITLGADNYKVRLSELTDGYYTTDVEYDLLAAQPQLTICLGASLRPQTNGVKYRVGSILCDFSLYYYDDPDGEMKMSSFAEILSEYKGILINFYFKGCQPCANEMPSLVSVANTFKDDIKVLMVNEGIRNNSDDDVKYFQRTYANNSPLWFVTIARSRFLYNYFNNLIGGFPTTILIDCNGQIVYYHANQMSVTGFTSAINTYIINRYNKLHPVTETANYTVESCEVFLPSDKFRLSMSEA